MKEAFLITFLAFLVGQMSPQGQNQETLCNLDTVELVLAYEHEGQNYLDDMILKSRELIEYTGDKITSEDYKSGVYSFIMPLLTNRRKLKNCGVYISVDSISTAKDPFQNLDTKTICQRNNSFKGKGTSMVGNEKTSWKYRDFKYKIFRVRFARVYIGIEKRTLVNIDRKTRFGEELLTISCPIYVMTEIFSIEQVK